MQMINGRTSSWREWQVVLAPKRLGKLSVPALSVGNAKTPTLSLEVLAADQAAKGMNSHGRISTPGMHSRTGAHPDADIRCCFGHAPGNTDNLLLGDTT